MTEPLTLEQFTTHMQENVSGFDFKATFSTVSQDLCRFHSGYFDAQADPSGNQWAPISRKTADSRYLRDLGGGGIGSGRLGKPKEAAARAVGFVPDHTILIDQGAMKASVAFRGNSDHVEHIDKLTMEWGTKDEKAAVHQFGARRRAYDERAEKWVEITIPPRPFVGWNEPAIEAATNHIADAAVEQLLRNI